MAVCTLVAFCAGATCIMTKTDKSHDAIQAESFVRYLSTELEADCTKLSGFEKWVTMKTTNEKMDFIGSIDVTVNPALMKIKNLVDAANDDGKDANDCYEKACQSIEEAANEKLVLVTECVNAFVESTNENLRYVPEHMAKATALKTEVEFIFIECRTADNPEHCINDRAKSLYNDISSFESFTRQTTEKGNGDYYRKYKEAKNCVIPILDALKRRVDDIRSEASTCIKNA